jgi:hypothetical protein
MSEFTELELKELLSKDSKTLAIVVVSNRVLGCYKSESKQCMIELMKRRSSGEVFEFENFIKENVQNYKINLNIPNVKEIKQKFVSSVISGIIQGSLFNDDGKEGEEEDLSVID